MSTLIINRVTSRATAVRLTTDTLVVDLADGRTVSVPLAWYPRLLHSSPEERANHRLIGEGEGIHWPDLDEDISVENILAGKVSGEGSNPGCVAVPQCGSRTLPEWFPAILSTSKSGPHLASLPLSRNHAVETQRLLGLFA